MRYKKYLIFTLMLIIMIFTISSVCANEGLTQELNTDEVTTLAVYNENADDNLDNIEVNSIDDSSSALGIANDMKKSKEIENDENLSNEENLVEESSSVLGIADDMKKSKEIENDESLSNENQVLRASNDEPVLGTNQYLNGWGDGTGQDVMNAIVECSRTGGGTVYLYGRTYNGGYTLTANQNEIRYIRNVRVVGGSPENPNQMAKFSLSNPGWVALTFKGYSEHMPNYPNNRQGYFNTSGFRLENVTFEYLNCTNARLFSFSSGSLTNVVFNHCESYQHLFFAYGCYFTNSTLPMINCNFTNCRQYYLGENDVKDTTGQLGAVFGAKLVGCNFINTSSANHGGAFCLADESDWGTARVASSLINCSFINVTSRWFAVYVHGSFRTSLEHLSEPQIIENCKFINCTATGEYGGALGISHHDTIVRDSEFINCTGGQGSAIMVGGIDKNHDAFNGDNTLANNITVENCTFKNNIAKIKGQSSSVSPDHGYFVGSPTGNAGAVYVWGNDTKVIDCIFDSNVADSGDGAAVYIYGDRTTVVNSQFYNHKSDNGTVYIEGDDTVVSDSIFKNNTAINGACVYIKGDDTKISNSTFDSNNATRGAGVYIEGHDTNITSGSTFKNNTAEDGAGVYIKGDDTDIIDSTFEYNNATNGGAVYMNGHYATVSSNTFDHNNVTNQGGAVYIEGSGTQINSNTFTDNEAVPASAQGTTGLGGAIYVKGDNTATDSNNFTHNKARNGSAIYTDGNNFRLHNDVFNENQAWSYLLIVTPNPKSSLYNTTDVNVTVRHVGGDNIINAIHNTAANSEIHFLNVTYRHSNGNSTTTDPSVYVSPVNGAENSQGGTLLYQDDREYLQKIFLHIEHEDGELIYETPADNLLITNIYGEVNVTLKRPVRAVHQLSVPLRVGTYNVSANHPEDWNYKYIENRTTFDVYYLLNLTINKTVDRPVVFVGETVVFTINVTNNGPSNATHVRITDVLPEQFAYAGTNDTGYSNSTNVLIVDWLAVGDSYAFTINATVLVNGTWTNNATANCTENETVVWDDATVTVVPKVNVTVTKVWSDDGNRDGVRPVNVTVLLFADNVNIRNATLNESTNWTFTFEDLAEYDYKTGVVIAYRVNETKVENYTVKITDDGKGNWTVNNTHELELINVTVKKFWDDGNNATGARPGSVVIELLADGQPFNSTTLNATNNWTYTFEGLYKYKHNRTLIVYTINETVVDNYISYTTSDGNGNWTVNNTFVTRFTVEKVWIDGNNATGTRPGSVVIELLADGQSFNSTTLNVTNSWKYTFVNLTRFDANGKAINYTVAELNVSGYKVVISNSTAYAWTVENTELVNLTVEKVWTDKDNQDGVRADNVTVHLISDGTIIDTVVLDASNDWRHTFLNLDEYDNNGTLIAYNVNETEVANYTVNITRNNYEFLVNNTHEIELVNVTVVKVWNDNNNASGQRPASVTVLLFADNVNIGNATLDASVDWKHTFIDLPVYKNNGTLIKYSIGEVDVGVPGYTTKVTNSTPYSWKVNNTYVPDTDKIANESSVYYHDFVKYNITITNTGTGVYNETLTIVDSLPYGLDYNKTVSITGARIIKDAVYDKDANNITWVITDIDPDTPAIITILVGTYDIGNLTNNVTLIGPNGYNKKVNATVEVKPIVDVAIEKTVDNETHFIGDVVVWTIKVSNAFNGTNATDVVMNDLLPAEFEFINCTATVGNYDAASGIWTIGFMGNGTEETLVINSIAKVVGTFINIANVTCNETDWNKDNNVDNATVTVVDNPDIKKAVNNTTPYNHKYVEYYLTISNSENIDYTKNLVVIDSLPDGLVYSETMKIEGATLVKQVVDGQIINWTLTNIKAKSSAVITVKVYVNATGNLTNNGTLIPHYGNSKTVNCTITPIPVADLEVIKLSDNNRQNTKTYYKGDNVTWTIKVINHGPDDAVNAYATDLLPSGLVYVSDDSNGAFDHTTGIWNIGNLSSGDSVILNIVTVISKTNVKITNPVNVTSDTYDPNLTNNRDKNTIKVAPEADLEIIKLVSKETCRANDIITWTIIVKNNGPDTAVNAVVSDKLPAGLVYVSDDSNGAYNHKTGVWKLGNIKKGELKTLKIKTKVNAANRTITNVAKVTSDTFDPDKTNNKANNSTTVSPVADLMLIKDVDKKSVKVGEKVEFTIVVINKGPDTAINTRAYDMLPKGLKFINYTASKGIYDNETGKWDIGDLDCGERVSLTIVAEALVVGRHVNEAYVESDTFDNDTSNNYDNATVDVVPEPPRLHETGNPIVMVLLSLLSIVGISVRRKN